MLLSMLLLCASPSLSGTQAAAVVEGTASEVTRGLSDPKVEPLNREILEFFVALDPGTTTDRRRSVKVVMKKRTIEGTVRNQGRVRVEGEWDGAGALRADRITDLNTRATIGFESDNPRFPEDAPLSLRGAAQFVEEKVAGHRGEWNQTQKIRFAVSVEEAHGPWRAGEIVSVEMIKRRIDGASPRSGRPVLVVGRWTKRNVLRAETITDEESGAQTK